MTSNTLPQFSRARSVILAKDTMSVMVKLETKIEESTCGVLDYDMVFHHMAHSRNKYRKAILPFLSRQADCWMQVDDVPSKRRWIT